MASKSKNISGEHYLPAIEALVLLLFFSLAGVLLWLRKHMDRQLARLGLWLTAKLANDGLRDKSLAKAELYSLHERWYHSFNHRAAQALIFSSDYSNVQTLTSALRIASYALENNKQIDPTAYSSSTRKISLEDFFIDDQHRYIDAYSAVVSFKKEALAFLELYYAIEKVDYGIPNFNHRVLSKLVQSCIATARVLKEFS